jgi:hypothetical protein
VTLKHGLGNCSATSMGCEACWSEQILNNSVLHQSVKTALLELIRFLFFMATKFWFVVPTKTRTSSGSVRLDPVAHYKSHGPAVRGAT